MLAKDYGFTVYAADLWSDPQENRKFFDEIGLSREQIIPVKADAADFPFEKDFFDAVVSTDSYNFWGRDPGYLDTKLLPFVKSGGYLYICVPGMKKDCHDNLPEELLLSWTPEQLAYLRDITYWTEILNSSRDAEVISIYEMKGNNDELWADWIRQENEIAVNDRKAIGAGGGKYLNFIAFVLRKK
jgi:SAM-dependent methyltransferase